MSTEKQEPGKDTIVDLDQAVLMACIKELQRLQPDDRGRIVRCLGKFFGVMP